MQLFYPRLMLDGKPAWHEPYDPDSDPILMRIDARFDELERLLRLLYRLYTAIFVFGCVVIGAME